MAWTFGAATDIGDRSEQQDRVAVLHAPDGRRHLIVLADGMGGLQDGALAAQMLVDSASQRFGQFQGGDVFALLEDICLGAHDALRQLGGAASTAPGTTAVLLYLDKQTAAWLHVGDSRLYHFRKGNLFSCTNDHSMLQMMLSQGLVEAGSSEAAAVQNRLYMRLGSEAEPEPDFNSVKLEDGDLFLLCSDGFWQALQAEDMLAALAKHPLEQDGLHNLMDLARQRSGEGSDNISVAVAQWQAVGFWQRLRSR